jgi:hypothetical protein
MATPKGFGAGRSWPVVLIDAPATDKSIARYQPLADGAGALVITVQVQSKPTVWPAEVQARIYFYLINRLGREIPIDRTRVYLLVGPDSGKKMQAVAAKLTLARCVDVKEDGSADAIGKAVKGLLEKDQAVVKAELDKLVAQASKIAKTQPGKALTIYRRIAGSGLKDPKVDQAAKAVAKLTSECGRLSKAKAKATRPAANATDATIEMFKLAQRFQGTPEGNKLLWIVKKKLEAQ